MTKKGYCDFRCWHASGKTCRCWCQGLNHGIGYVPDNFDPKYGLTEADYEALCRMKMREEQDEVRDNSGK